MLPGISIELWKTQVLNLVGEKLGKFVYVDERSLKGNNKKMASLLVELDISKGLISEIEIIRGKHSFF